MKCPKCAYLGFETGDRCRNCGYDFSLLWAPTADRRDELRHERVDTSERRLSLEPDYEFRTQTDDEVFIQVNADLKDPGRPSPKADLPLRMVMASPLPLFTPPGSEDEPLVKVPAAPRAPLAVRRPVDSPRPRSVARAARPSSEPALQFPNEAALVALPMQPAMPLPAMPLSPPALEPEARSAPAAVTSRASAIDGSVSRSGPRLLAAVVDHVILFGIDLGVVYFTVRMAGLPMSEWRLLPAAPMLAFLGLLKLSYFYAFTAVGGQTIGKMAAGTCVIADDGGPLDAGRVMRRTCAGLVSALLFGLGWVPALFGRRLALHDRVARTRVVPLRSV
jgi:uncharacterized RDD family membrane protein YckC